MGKIKPCQKGYGLIGKTLTYSYSKEIHEALGAYSFDLWEVAEKDIKEFLKARDFKGAMITIPYKKEALAAADKVSIQAKTVGAANILYFDEEGNLCADNTDYYGFIYMISRMGLSLRGKNVLVLGDGATSGTVCQAVKDLGASSLKVASRHPETHKDKSYNKNYCVVSYDEDFSDREIIVNTTSAGTFPLNGEKILSLTNMKSLEGVVDLIYNPFATALLLEAEDLGIKRSNGFPMLVAQATKGGELFMKGMPEGKTWEEWNGKLIGHFEEKYYNKVLIGMPGSGKTTMGKELAKQLNREFVDTDQIIEEKTALTIPEIFEKNGEEFFRKLELEIAKDIGKKKSLVIATGGGMVLQKEAMDSLRQNGKVIWLKTPLEDLSQEGRPLSLGIKALEKIWAEREVLYSKYADQIVNRDEDEII